MDKETKSRLPLLRSAIGKPEDEVRKIIATRDGVYRHEIDAVMLKLYSIGSDAFNEGRDAYLNKKTRKDCPYSTLSSYRDYISWHTAYDATELAVELHGIKAVYDTL